MGKLATAGERVSRDASDSFVFQRSLLAYDRAAGIMSGDVLEIGTGTGYGIRTRRAALRPVRHGGQMRAGGDRHAASVEFRRMCVPPLGFGRIVRFRHYLPGDQYIDDDAAFVREIARAAAGRTADLHHAQRSMLAHTQPVARA